jgi:class 3 adenylate cyclase
MTSQFLAKIVESENGITPLQVVFCDVESYSQRKTINQAAVVAAVTQTLHECLVELAQQHQEFTRASELNLLTDTVVIPTGDGAAVAFPIVALRGLHLAFARHLLRKAKELRREECTIFEEFGWCDCHDYFNLRIGLSHDDGIIYRDVNGNFNAAGAVVNIASRIMNAAGRNGILITEDAYQKIEQFVTDRALLARFTPPRES